MCQLERRRKKIVYKRGTLKLTVQGANYGASALTGPTAFIEIDLLIRSDTLLRPLRGTAVHTTVQPRCQGDLQGAFDSLRHAVDRDADEHRAGNAERHADAHRPCGVHERFSRRAGNG